MDKNNLILSSALGETDLFFEDSTLSNVSIDGIMGLDNVYEKLKFIDSISEDKMVSLDNMRFDIENSSLILEGSAIDYTNIVADIEGSQHPMSAWGLGQICSSLGVPASYIRKCIYDDAGEIGVGNLNYWKYRAHDRRPEKEYLCRLTDNRLHGFLSSKYDTYDDSKFLDIVTKSIHGDSNYFISNQVISPDITKLRIVSSEKMLIDGDEYSVALDVSNSRVGRSSVKLQLLLYRWICSNGMIMGGKSELVHQMHRSIDEVALQGEIQMLVSNLPELLVNAKEWTEKAKSNRLNTESLEMLTDNFKAKVLNSDAAVLHIKTLMIENYNQSIWGYANAITEVAQKYSVFTRESMEKYAGGVFQKGDNINIVKIIEPILEEGGN